MTITITNRMGKSAMQYLESNSSRLPIFSISNTRVYNGISVTVDDDDAEDFQDALESAGFQAESEDTQSSSTAKFPKDVKDVPKLPRFEKLKPVLPKR